MAEGVLVRHSKRCATRRDGACDCVPTYQAQVLDSRQGRRIRRSFKTITEAKRWRQEAIVAIRHGQRARYSPARGQTVRQALDALLAGMADGTVLDRSGRRYRAATIRSYKQAVDGYVNPALGHLRLSEVARRDVQKLIDRMHAAGLGGSTIRNKLDPLRVVYRRALQDEDVAASPMTNLRLPAVKSSPCRVVNADRAAELLDALPDGQRALWATAFYAGLRIGELRALRFGDVDFEAGVIRVRAGWDDVEGEQATKTTAGERVIPMIGRLRAELARHRLAQGAGPDALCFGRSASSPFTRSTVQARR